MGPYQYQPLDSEANTIRLLRLLPGSFEDDICVSLETTVLCEDSIPKYEALSYAWGSTEDPVNISVKPRPHENPPTGQRLDGLLGVTQNLAVALRHLRRQEGNRDLWIDAICVDQRNSVERGHQVERMADIYRYADQVVAWIGPAGNNSALAMKTLGSLGSRIEIDWDTTTTSPFFPDHADLADFKLPLTYDVKTWSSLQFLLTRHWFKRLWVWQEILLPRSANLQCGYDSMDWSNFRTAIRYIHVKDRIRRRLGRDTFAHIIRFIVSEASEYALKDLMYATQQCECSDPRDRIYALLNIVHQKDSVVGLRSDYTQRTSRIYQDVLLRAMSLKGELELMSHCEWNTDTVRKPSWVPDFSHCRTSHRIEFPHCCYGSKAKAEYAGNGLLEVTGISVAEISGIKKIELVSIEYSYTAKLERAIRRVIGTVNLGASYLDRSDMLEAVCRTLCMDICVDSCTPARPGYLQLEKASQYLRRLSLSSTGNAQPYEECLTRVEHYLKGRNFFTTKQGYIGLIPEAGKRGDQVCVILGCQSPMLLRRMGSGNMVVIGECYIHGLMNGEALLGTPSSKWQNSWIVSVGSGYQKGFVDQETGENLFEDPRLRELPIGWRLANPEARADWNNWFINDETGARPEWPMDPRMTAEALRNRGVPLQEFRLE